MLIELCLSRESGATSRARIPRRLVLLMHGAHMRLAVSSLSKCRRTMGTLEGPNILMHHPNVLVAVRLLPKRRVTNIANKRP